MPTNHWNRRMKTLRKRIKNADLSEENRGLLWEFKRDLEVQDYSKGRIYKLLNYLKIIGEHIDYNFEEATEEDIKDTVAWLNRRDVSDATKCDTRAILKRFYKWIGNGEYPDKVKWINTTVKRSNNTLPKDMLNEEDVQKLIEAAYNTRDKAIISMLWETGARIGELIDLKINDLEDYIARDLTLKEAREFAIDEYLTNYKALGLNIEKCNVYFQSQSDSVQRLAYTLGKSVTFSELRAIYGFENDSDASHIFYPMIDVADILRPQLEEFEGPSPSVIPVGIDQDPHIRLSRDVADRFESEFGFVPPSSTYSRLISGLTGEKMSSSNSKSAIFLTDSVEEVEQKIANAVTGGRHTVDEQREKGGKPDECIIYSLYVYHLIPDDEELLEMRESCESGDIICGECKERAMELLKDFLGEHRKKREDAKDLVEKAYSDE